MSELTETEISVIEAEKNKKVYSTHTKFCTFGNNCKKKYKCVFAHNFKELCPIMCKYDKECLRKEKCYYMHTYETKVQYVKRTFPEDLEKFNIKLVDFHEKIEEKNIEVEEEVDHHENIIEIKKLIHNLYKMYHDPIFEHKEWEYINDLVDLDCYEEDKNKKVLYTL